MASNGTVEEEEEVEMETDLSPGNNTNGTRVHIWYAWRACIRDTFNMHVEHSWAAS